MLQTFQAAFYAKQLRENLSSLGVPDLDTAEHVWGHIDSSYSFRNVLVGSPESRGEIWSAWITNGNIEISDQNKFYVLRQEQSIGADKIDRFAIYAMVNVHDAGLFIHEDVLPEGVERARQAMESCESDMAPIFVGCEERLGKALRGILEPYCYKNQSLLEFRENEHSRHRVWELNDLSSEIQIKQMFENVPLFLLDGHHRLAAARENARLGMGDGNILICLSSFDSVDTLILPIHRAIYSERWILPDALMADLVRAGCQVTELSQDKSITEHLKSISPTEPACILQHSYSNHPLLVKLPSVYDLTPRMNQLAVARLDYGVLKQQNHLTSIPVTDIAQALEQLAMDQAQAAFFLPSASPDQVRAIALGKEMMPRKSTRFVPKPALGLITRPWLHTSR